jgi:hypothetical protein
VRVTSPSLSWSAAKKSACRLRMPPSSSFLESSVVTEITPSLLSSKSAMRASTHSATVRGPSWPAVVEGVGFMADGVGPAFVELMFMVVSDRDSSGPPPPVSSGSGDIRCW